MKRLGDELAAEPGAPGVALDPAGYPEQA